MRASPLRVRNLRPMTSSSSSIRDDSFLEDLNGIVLPADPIPTRLQRAKGWLRRKWNQHRNKVICVCEATGGAAVSHVGCLVAPAISGAATSTLTSGLVRAFGDAAFSLPIGNIFMVGSSMMMATGVTYTLGAMRRTPANMTKLATSAAIALPIALGFSYAFPHDQSNDAAHNAQSAKAWVDTLDPTTKARLTSWAKEEGQTLEQFVVARSLCVPISPPKAGP